MLALGSHQHPLEARLVVQLFDLVQPFEGVAEGVLVGAVVNHHHQVGVLAHAQGDRLVELVPAEVEEEQLHGGLVGERDDLGQDVAALGLSRGRSTIW